MAHRTIYNIFKKGSRTYFYNSLFFPPEIKDDVFTLYSFVRKADNYVDCVPQKKKSFYNFKTRIHKALDGKRTGDVVADHFAELSNRTGFYPEWHDSFLGSMEMDLTKSSYDSLEELEDYIYGSAEVIGLYMAKVMDLPESSYHNARHLGKAMQLINFIRDIDEDLTFGRVYMPIEIMQRHGLDSLDYETTVSNPRKFKAFIDDIVGVYMGWQKTAEEGYKHLPRRYLIPVMNAAEMYKWTARKIAKDPFVIYQKKVKPSVPRIMVNYGFNALTAAY